MDLIEALVLGIVQGLTEWLPVSSSGHLVIAQEMLGLPAGENLVFDLVVHLGTLCAVCAYFRKELGRILAAFAPGRDLHDAQARELRRLGALLLLGTAPAAAVGASLAGVMEEVFDIRLVGAALIINAGVLFAAERRGLRGGKRSVGPLDALVIGLFQAMAVVPGISRSGATISGGMLRGLEREAAAVFAFLLSVPTLLGAFAYGLVSLERYDLVLGEAVTGFAAAFLVGIACIGYLLRAVRARKLWLFSAYCACLGAAILVLTAI